MNDDEMDRRLSEFADQWTGEFTEPALPRPTVQPRVRRAWIGPTAVASLVAAAVVAVLMVSNIRDDRANPAVSPPTTGQSEAGRTSVMTTTDDPASGGPGSAAPTSEMQDLPETITLNGTVYRRGDAVPWFEAITDGETIAVTTGPEIRGACDRTFYRLRLAEEDGVVSVTAFGYIADSDGSADCPGIGLPPAVATINLPAEPVDELIDGTTGQSHPLRPLLFPANLPSGMERDTEYSAEWPQLTDPDRPAPYWTTATWTGNGRALTLQQYGNPPPTGEQDEGQTTVRGTTARFLTGQLATGDRCLAWTDEASGDTLLCSHGSGAVEPLWPEDLMVIAESMERPTQESSTPTTSRKPAEVPVEGTTWYLVGRINNSLTMREPANPDRWIRFSSGTLTLNGYADDEEFSDQPQCPTIEVPATVTDGVVAFGDGALDSEAGHQGCGGEVLNSDPAGVRVSVNGRELELKSDQGMNKTVLIYQADPPAEPAVPDTVDLEFLPPPTAEIARDKLANPLQGKKFRSTKITDRELVEPGITMEFGVDQVGLYAGCNNGGAGYSIAGDTITFTPGGWNAAGCLGPEGEQESWLMKFAGGDATFEIKGSVLRLTSADQTMTLKQSGTVEPVDPVSPTSGDHTAPEVSATIDEIVTDDGHHPLPELESGQFWGELPRVTINPASVIFDVGCGALRSATTGTMPNLTAGAFDGQWLVDCPPNRTALAQALRYILSGPLHIERDGAFVTITGRDGIAVTAHSGG